MRPVRPSLLALNCKRLVVTTNRVLLLQLESEVHLFTVPQKRSSQRGHQGPEVLHGPRPTLVVHEQEGHAGSHFQALLGSGQGPSVLEKQGASQVLRRFVVSSPCAPTGKVLVGCSVVIVRLSCARLKPVRFVTSRSPFALLRHRAHSLCYVGRACCSSLFEARVNLSCFALLRHRTFPSVSNCAKTSDARRSAPFPPSAISLTLRRKWTFGCICATTTVSKGVLTAVKLMIAVASLARGNTKFDVFHLARVFFSNGWPLGHFVQSRFVRSSSIARFFPLQWKT